MQKRPANVVILGIPYGIAYFEKPSDVDLFHRESLLGQVDHWTRTIRVYDSGELPDAEVFRTILHEVLHGVLDEMHLKIERDGADDSENSAVDMLSTGLADVFLRNGWLRLE